jgi:hypothetical protein
MLHCEMRADGLTSAFLFVGDNIDHGPRSSASSIV